MVLDIINLLYKLAWRGKAICTRNCHFFIGRGKFMLIPSSTLNVYIQNIFSGLHFIQAICGFIVLQSKHFNFKLFSLIYY